MTKKIRSQKRAFIRAYHDRLREGKIEESSRILYDLINTPYHKKDMDLSDFSFIKENDLKSCTQQFLMVRVLDFEFIEQLTLALSRSNREIKHPLPPLWRKRLEEVFKIKANTNHNRILWIKFLSFWFLVGYFSGYYEWFKNFFSFKNDQFKDKESTYFHQLSKHNLPTKKKAGKIENNTIISWFANRNKSAEKIFSNVEGVEVSKIYGHHLYGTSTPWPRLKIFSSIVLLVFWSISFFVKCLYKLIKGEFIFPLMARELMIAKLVENIDEKRLPKKYMFHNSGFFFRPLWTYIAQERGSRIILYYYSTSDLWLKTKKGDMNKYNPYHIMSWPEYWIWNEYQLNFLKRFLSYEFNYEIVGPTWFSSTDTNSLDVLPKKGIAIFDIEPCRDSYQFKVFYPVEYYSYLLSKEFINDLISISNKHNINLFFKRKREGIYRHKGYLKIINNLSKEKNVFVIEPGIAAKSLIEKSLATITMPFSTTANISQSFKRPSIYYDPINKTIQGDPAAHGIQIIHEKLALERWILENYK